MLQSAQSVQCFGKKFLLVVLVRNIMRFVLLEMLDLKIKWLHGLRREATPSNWTLMMAVACSWKVPGRNFVFFGVLSLWLLLIVSFRELQIGVVVPQFLVLWFRNDSFQVSKSLIMHLGYKEDFCARRICTKRSWHQIPEKIEKIENSLWGRLQGNKPSWTGDTSEAI